MPNVTAASYDGDFGVKAQGRRKAPRRTGRKKGGKTRKARSALLGSMPRVGAIAISATIGVGIVVNALMMQHGHHPAPLFGAAASAGAAAGRTAAAKVEAKPVAATDAKSDAKTAAARADVTAEAPAAGRLLAATDAAEAIPAARPVVAKSARGDDPIARLIGGAAAGTPPHRGKTTMAKAAQVKSAPDRHRRTED